MQASEIVSTAGLGSAAEISSPGGRPVYPAAPAEEKRAATTRPGGDGARQDESGHGPDLGLRDAENKVTGLGNYYVGFEKDEKTGATIIKVVDRDSGQVLRQIPPDQVLAMMSRLREVQSLMFDRRA
jgi:flagellar protein FlaG